VWHEHGGGRSLSKLVVCCEELSSRWCNFGLAVHTRVVRSMTYLMNLSCIWACWHSTRKAVAMCGKDRSGWYFMRSM
jgi:hypothetical protein